MGKRLHVVSKKEEYGTREAFNWCWDDFRNLLDALLCDTLCEEFAERFACQRELFKRAITILRRYEEFGDKADIGDLEMTEGEKNHYNTLNDAIFFEDVEECLGYFAYTDKIDYILNVMEDYLEEADPNGKLMIFVAR